jgi:hypothetical protein
MNTITRVVLCMLVSATVSTVTFALPLVLPCGTTCRFSFCPVNPGFLFPIGMPDRSLTRPICDPLGKIVVGRVGSTGESIVSRMSLGPIKISKFAPIGLKQNFSPSFFKSFGILGSDLSGVGHEVPQQNQRNFLNKMCVVLPLTAYQVLNKPGGVVIDNVFPTNPLVDCVAFTTAG